MSDPTNKVPFFIAGEGAYLRFRTKDFVVLREKYGKPEVVKKKSSKVNGEEHEVEVWETFTDRLLTFVGIRDPVAIIDCLKNGLKQEDGSKPYAKISFDDLPFSFDDAVRPIQDAIIMAITGQDYAGLLRDQGENADKGDAPFSDPSLQNLLNEFSNMDTEPAS